MKRLFSQSGMIETVIENSQSDADLFVVMCHPHPQFGGNMDDKRLVYIQKKFIEHYNIPVVRFNFRGVGESRGTFDDGHGEVADLVDVVHTSRHELSRTAFILYGYSFGTAVIHNALLQFSKLYNDGIGVFLASKFLYGRKGFNQRLTGTDFYYYLLEYANKEKLRVSFLGGSTEAIENIGFIKELYPAGSYPNKEFLSDQRLLKIHK